MIVAGGNYSYCSGTQGGTPGPPFDGLRLTWEESLRAIAAAGAFTDVYEGSFSLPFGTPGFTAEVPARRREMEALGLRPGVLLVPTPFAQPEGEGGEGGAAARQALADEQRYRLIVEQAAAMGYCCIVDFGAGEAAGEHERYVALMRAVAPLAAAAGLQISMKPHGANGDDIVAGLLAVHRQIDRPGFGICLDPGNVVFYSDGRKKRSSSIRSHNVQSHLSEKIGCNCLRAAADGGSGGAGAVRQQPHRQGLRHRAGPAHVRLRQRRQGCARGPRHRPRRLCQHCEDAAWGWVSRSDHGGEAARGYRGGDRGELCRGEALCRRFAALRSE